MMKSKLSSIARVFLGAAALFGTSACLYTFDRGAELNPGDVGGRAFLEDGTAAGYARIVIDGTGRTKRAASDGTFVVSNLDAGTWALRIDFDRDGDGWPEAIAHRTVTIVETEDGERSSTLLGDVVLLAPSSLRGAVELPAGPSPSGVDVTVTRRTGLSVGDDTFSADQGVEARVATGADGRFFFPAIARGDSILRARVRTPDGALYIAEDFLTSVGPGSNQLDAPIVLTLVSESVAGGDDILPPGTIVSDERREAVLYATPKDDASESFAVDLVPTGQIPPLADFGGARVFSAGDTFVLDAVPFGTFDIYIRTDLDRSGVLFQRQVGPGAGSLSWGVIQLGQQLCPNRDCDGDGRAGLPPRVDAPDVWTECASQCTTGTTFDIAATATATCTVAGVVYDCEDDGDGQPDTTEPACYGLGLGGDHDGDTFCDPVDPYPFCAANDDTCDPEDVTGFYGVDVIDDLDGGPIPDASVDAGVDGGADGGADDAGVDGGVDGGIDVDAGLPAVVFPDPIGPIRDVPEHIFGDDRGGYYLFGDVGEGGSTTGLVGCLTEDPIPADFVWAYYAHFDATGVCDRLSYASAALPSSIRTHVGRDGSGFALSVVTFNPIRLGRDSSNAIVEDTTSGARIITVRLDADLNVTGFHRITTASASQQIFGRAPVLVRMSPTLTYLVGNPSSADVTYESEAGTTFTGSGSLVILELDGDFDMVAGFDAGSENGDALQLVTTVKDNAGLALLVTGSGTAFGEEISASSTILRLNGALGLAQAITADLVDVTHVVSNANAIFAAGQTAPDPSGMHVFRPSFASGLVINIALGEPGGIASGAGSVANVFNQNAAAFDPVTRSILTAGISEIQATPFPLVFNSPTRQVTIASTVRDIAIDATTRDLFYVDGSSQLYRCNLDTCVAPTLVAAFATSIDVDDVGNKIYFFGSGLQRANYDGTGLEVGFASPNANVVALDPVGRFFFVDSVGQFQRFEMDSVGAPPVSAGTASGVITQLEVDPISGRLYRVVSGIVESSEPDGLDPTTTTVNGGNGATQALFPIVAELPSVTANNAQVDVDFARALVIRIPNAAPPAVLPLATPESGEPNVIISDMVQTQDGLTVAANVVFGDIRLATGDRFEVQNERDAPSEVFVTRFTDDGSALTPQWVTTSQASEAMNIRGIDVDADGNTFSIVRSGHEGLLGQVPVSTQFPGFNFQPNVWRLPPQGDPAPSREFLAAGGREAALVLNTDFDALFAMPFRDTGHVATGETANPGTYYVTRVLPGSAPWRHELPYEPIALDVSPEGDAIAVLFKFTGSFDFLGESQTATDGLAMIVFGADGTLLSSGYTELNGATAQAIAVNDTGRYVVGYDIATTLVLDLQRQTPVPFNESGGFMVGYVDGFATSTHGGLPGTSCDSVDIDDAGNMVGVMNGAGNFIRLLHVRADFSFDWDVSLSVLDSTIEAQKVRVSRAGGLVALGVLNDGDVAISVVSTCDAAGYTELPDDAHYTVFAFRANGCDSGFGRILATRATAEAFDMDIVDRANNIVVVGPYDAADTVTVETDSAGDLALTIDTPNPGLFVANFHTQFFRLRARGLSAADNVDTPLLRGLGASTNGDVWLHVLTAPQLVRFSDAPEIESALTDGFVWILDLKTNDGFFSR